MMCKRDTCLLRAHVITVGGLRLVDLRIHAMRHKTEKQETSDFAYCGCPS